MCLSFGVLQLCPCRASMSLLHILLQQDVCLGLQAPRKFLTRTSTTLRRGFTQAFRCFSLYQSRLVLGVLIALVYGGTYSHLPYSFQGLQERLSLLFIVSAILPFLTLGSLPTFAHNDKVWVKP